jgi:hypothetical protein
MVMWRHLRRSFPIGFPEARRRNPVASGPFPGGPSVEQWGRGTKGADVKKLLIFLGILGIVVAIFLALKNRQDTYEFES